MDKTLNFYKHGFYGSPNGEVQQKVSPIGSAYAGTYTFIKVIDQDSEESDEPVWFLRFEDLNKKLKPLWQGNLPTQGILDAIANEYTNEKSA